MPLRALQKTLFALAAAPFLWAAASASAQLTLAADASAAPYHTVLHLTATGSTGIIVFYDNLTPFAAAVADPQGIAVLGVATLTPGPHTFFADSLTGTSRPVNVTVAPAPTNFQLNAGESPLVFQQSTLNLAALGLPPKATGTIAWSQDGVLFATSPINRNPPAPAYQALGDSITAGFTLLNPVSRYPDLLAAAWNFGPSSYNIAVSSAVTCDVLTTHILPNHLGPTQDAAPLSSLMIGTNDMDNFGVPRGEPNFSTCHQAALAWLAIPREYKVLPGDPGATILSGPWQLPPAKFDSTYGTLYNSSGAGAAQFSVTSNGGPLYLWYLLGDHITGAFTVSLDGIPTGTTYTTNPVDSIGSKNNPDSTGFAFLRFPVAAGPHTLRVDIAAGTVGILAAATPPSPDAASVHPTVLATDVPNQNLSQAAANPASIQQFSAVALADIALLVKDGLDIRTIPTHTFLGSSALEFTDFVHPNLLGHRHLADAFQDAYTPASLTPFLTWTASIPRQYPIARELGSHTFTATYSGDEIYAPFTASTTLNVVAAGHSITTLTAAATTFYAAQPVTASATLFPPTPGAVLTLMEAGQTLASAPASNANFSVASLPPGLHTLYAAYAGDKTNTASASPALTIQILKNVTTLALTGPPAQLAYATPITLTAQLQPATATGTITFTDDYTPNPQFSGQSVATHTQTLGRPTPTAGTATLSLATLPPGLHTLTATYSGDPSNNPATSSPTITFIQTVPTATTLSAAPAPFGRPTTFTAVVSPAAPAGPLTGTVTFTDLTANVSTQATLTGGTATWTASNFTAGSHNITAAYAGDPSYAPSTATQLTAVIARDPSTLTLTPTATLYRLGDSVTLTAAITPTTATGTILFTDPAAGTLGQATLTAGTATLTLPALPLGTYTITATYAGDPNTLPAASTPATFQVLSRATATTLSAPASAIFANAVTFTATVSPAPAPGALIRFTDNGTLLGTTALQNGTATFSTSTLAAGPHALTATFPGNGILDPSSGTAAVTITQAASATTITLAQATLLAGSPATVNLRIATASAIPTGTVTLRSGSTTLASGPLANGTAGVAYATLSFPTSATGTFPITAFYSGDNNTAASDSTASPLSFTVSPRIATGIFTLSATQVPPQTPVTLTAVFTSPATAGPALIPTGSVAFSVGGTALANVPLDPTGKASTTLPPALLGAYTLTAAYTPTGVFTASAIPAQTLTVTAPLAVAFTTPTLAMSPGAAADATAAVTPLSGFQGTVATKCATDAPYLTCTVEAPATVTGNATATAKVHLAVARTTASTTTTIVLACLLPTLLLARRRRLAPLLLLFLSATILITLTGCAEGGNFGDIPSGTHYLHLTATAANTPTTATLTITIP